MNQWLVKGLERHTEKPLTIVYSGHQSGLAFVRDLAFGDSCRAQYLGKVWIFNRNRLLTPDLEEALHFVEMRETLAKNDSRRRQFYVPMWIDGELDTEKAIELSRKTGNIKEDLRRIRKNKLEYEVTSDDERISDFHRDMYVPYIRNTFGPAALFHSLEDLKKSKGTIELLVIRRDEEVLAGQIIVYEHDGVRTREIGVKNGDRQYVKAGVMGALYYYGLLHLQSRGFKTVGLGGSRAWLNDGVLRFKKKWGMRLGKPWPSGFLLVAPKRSEGAAAFLANNPFLSITEGRLEGTVFSDSSGAISARYVKKLHRDYFYEGMSKLLIYPLRSDYCRTEIPDELAGVVCQESYFWSDDDT